MSSSLKQIAVLFLIMAMASTLVFFKLVKVEESRIISIISIYLVLFLRMIVFPLTVVLFAKYCGLASLVPDGDTIMVICLLAAIAPTAATVNQLAILYNRQPEYSSAINALSTMLCIVTMPLMMGIYFY